MTGRRPGRRAAVLVAGIVAACAVGWVASRGGIGSPGTEPAAAAEPAATSASPSPPPAPTSSPPAPTFPPAADIPATPSGADAWQRLVDDLYRRRAEAFTTRSGRLLEQVYTDASPQRTADGRALAQLLADRRGVRGFAPRVDRVTAVAVQGSTATVDLTDSWPAYTVVDDQGRAAATVAARAPIGVRLVLQRSAGGWRIDTVERVG